MKACLNFNADEVGATFSCREKGQNIPVSQWKISEIALPDGNPAGLGPLNLLIEEGAAYKGDDGYSIFVPHSSLAELELWQSKSLGLPPLAPLRLVIHTRGILSSENFVIKYGFTYHDSLPVSRFVRTGTFLNCDDKRFLLTNPLYSVIELIDKYIANPIADMDERFLWWGQVRQLLPEDTDLGNFLKTINIIKPASFTLDVSLGTGDIVIVPRFVLPVGMEASEILTSDENEPTNLIPQAVQDEFSRMFLSEHEARARYALPKRWFVVIPETLKIALQSVREINNASQEQKRAFIANPRTEIRKRLELTIDEEILETLFVETQIFLSQRIKMLGVWAPKLGIFIKTDKGTWFPENGLSPSIGVPINGGIYNIESAKLPDLKKEMERALGSGLNELTYDGVTYPVNAYSLNIISEAENNFLRIEKPDTPEKKEKIHSSMQPPVPIIHDHIEVLGIVANGEGERPYIECEPALKKDVILHEHQEKGLKWLKEHWNKKSPGALLADDMGLGKTLQALAFMSWVRKQMHSGYIPTMPFLVVAPVGLLKTWEDEANEFLIPGALGELLRAHGSYFSDRADHGWLSSTISSMKEAGWVLTTYETLRDKIWAFIGVNFSVAVFDEVQKIKNPKAMVTDMAKSIKAEVTLAITGTPVENSLTDLWCIVDTVHPGKFGTLKDFVKLYMPEGSPKLEELDTLKRKISNDRKAPLMLRRSKEENWKERPEKAERLYENIMPEVQANYYSAAVDRARFSEGKKGAMLEALHALRSISLHPKIQDGLRNEPRKYIAASARLMTTFSLLDKIRSQGEKVLVFVEYIEMQAILSQLIESLYDGLKPMIINGKVTGPMRNKKKEEFQDESNKGFNVMILSPKLGVGLTLTAATHVIHLSRWWNPAVEDQCSDRAYRIGQKRPVTIHYPLAIHPSYGKEYSFDFKLHKLLEKKRMLSRKLLVPPAGTDQDIEELFRGSVTALSNTYEHKGHIKDQSIKPSLEDIDLMEPKEFERWALNSFKEKGYEVKSTPTSYDAGADGIAYSPKESNYPSFIIQCKHTQRSSNLGHQAVNEVLNALKRYSQLPLDVQPIVLTNAHGFTENAKKIAADKGVKLIDRYRLVAFFADIPQVLL